MRLTRRRFTGAAAALLMVAAAILPAGAAQAADAARLEAAANATLERLKASEPVTGQMIRKAKGILIFPEIVKGGLIVGGATGEGIMRVNGKTAGFYRSTALSFGYQAGLTKFGYVLFLMDDAAMNFTRESHGWEVGTAPNVTIADMGIARRLSTSTMQKGIYVFFVDQTGLFAGAGLEGTRITKIAD